LATILRKALSCRVRCQFLLIITLACAASAQSASRIENLVSAGNLDGMRWPNFSDYRSWLQKFYQPGGYAPVWTQGNTPSPQALAMIDQFRNAWQKGLEPDDYDASRWDTRLQGLKSSSADRDAFDVALTVSTMRFISDLHIGRINPRHFEFDFDSDQRKYDLAQFLRERVLPASDMSSVIDSVEPPYPGYKRTKQALQTYVQLAQKDNGEQLPPIKGKIVPGATYAGVPRLTQLLRLTGDLPADANVPADSTTYSGPLVEAVKKFQGRHGRDRNGQIDTQTLADLNVPLSRRVRQMQLTLERWRWLPEAYQQSPIVANIPEFRLRAYDKDFNIGVTMNVVVGKAYGHNTPVFSDTMEYVVFRPYWDVPPSIIRGEILPKLVRDPNYLAKKGFVLVDSSRNVVASGTVSSEMIAQLKAGKLFVRQKPGPTNALGLAKFIFPNSYNVYMHDTPATEFFARSRRDFSHGCIRLEKPADLAAWVLRDNSGWNPERIRAAMKGNDDSQQVNLTHPIPVLIVYGTVIVLEDGLVHFYDDIYKQDAALDKALAQGYPYPW